MGVTRDVVQGVLAGSAGWQSAHLLCGLRSVSGGRRLLFCSLQDSVQSGQVEVQGLRVETRFISGDAASWHGMAPRLQHAFSPLTAVFLARTT